MVSSRDRILSTSKTGWLNLSPERRRLRFSFQFNNVKDPNNLSRPTALRPAPAKSGVSSRHPRLCQPASESFLGTSARANPAFSRDKTFHPGLPRHPPKLKAESIEAAEHTPRRWICKA
jgi:hypothetical protein